ncbi:MAG: hypothetical protein ACTHJ5_01480 [Ilyomonas sp.]
MEGSCSRMFEITTRTIHIDTTSFCNDRKQGEKLTMQSHLQIDIKQDDNSDDYKLTVPLIMLLDPRNVFGCPDCLDQGGSYFEFTLLGTTRHFEVEKGKEPIYFSSLTEQIASKFLDIDNRVKKNSR